MPSRSFGNPPSEPPQTFGNAPPTAVDPWASPTQPASEVAEALAAHEYSLARSHRVASEEPVIEWEVDVESDVVSVTDFDGLPTRMKTPAPMLPLVRLDLPIASVFDGDRLPIWPLLPAPRGTARRTRPQTSAIWTVLLVSGVLVSMALLLVLIRGVPVGPVNAGVSPSPPALAGPTVVPLPSFDPPAPAVESSAPGRPERAERRRKARSSSRPVAAAVEPAPSDSQEPPRRELADHRPNPF
jgi:hypothetical protein